MLRLSWRQGLGKLTHERTKHVQTKLEFKSESWLGSFGELIIGILDRNGKIARLLPG